MKATIVAQRLAYQFPDIKGIAAENDTIIHLGNAAEGGTIMDKAAKSIADLMKSDWGTPAADYYGEFRGGYPWIHPDLETAVEKYGYEIEWMSAGELKAYRL